MERHSDKVSIKMKKLDAVLMMGMVLMVLTFFSFSIWGCISAYNTIKEEAKEKVLKSSMAAASEVNRVLGIKLEILSYIASMPEISNMDFKEQKTYINGKDDQTGFHHLFVVDLEGNGYYFEEGVILNSKGEYVACKDLSLVREKNNL